MARVTPAPPGELRVLGQSRRGGLAPPEDRWGTLSGRRRVVIFVHGYNVSQPDGEDVWVGTHKLLQRRVKPEHLNDLCLFYWPGDRWSVIGYFKMVPVAVEAGQVLATFLTGIGTRKSPLVVDFAGHSLGCRVVLSALAHLRDVPQVTVGRVILMAAAVPEGLCAETMAYGADHVAGRATVIFSELDGVLRKYFPGGQWAARHLTADPDLDPGINRVAVGRSGGPEHRWEGERDSCGLDHGDYWRDADNVSKLVPLFAPPATRKPRARRMGARAIPKAKVPARAVRKRRVRS